MTDTLVPAPPASPAAPASQGASASPVASPSGSAVVWAVASGSCPGSAAVVLGVVADTVGDLAQTLWAARSPAELLATVAAAERLRSVLVAMVLRVVAEIDATHAAATEDWASTKDYLTAVTGGRTGEGRRRLALAKALTSDRAATGTALAAGDPWRVHTEAS